MLDSLYTILIYQLVVDIRLRMFKAGIFLILKKYFASLSLFLDDKDKIF